MTDRIIERDDGQPGETQLPRPARRSRVQTYLHDIAASLRKLSQREEKREG